MPEPKKLKESYLVQRLKVPMEHKLPDKRWELTKDGKVSEEMIKLREGVCEYDYMGSSEFEWGSIPDAIRMVMHKREHLVTFSMSMKGEPVMRSWTDMKTVCPDFELYVLCTKEEKEAVKERIPILFTDANQRNMKELLFYPPLAMEDKKFSVRGWFELNNGFYFFTSKKMWEGMTMLYTGKKPQ